MASKYDDLLKLQERQQAQYGVPSMPAQNPLQGLLQTIASVAQQTGNPNTERGQIFQGAGNAYLSGLNQQNKQQFFSQVSQISQAPIDPAQKINLLTSLKAQHGTDYGLGVDDIAKQFQELRGQDITMRGQDMTAQNNRRDIANKTYLDLKKLRADKKQTEWKPQTKEEALSFESAKAGMKPPTQAQETTALYASRLKQANDVFDSLENFINNQGVGAYVQSGLPSFAQGGDMQSYQQAQRNFLNAVLRRESGAVISQSEFKDGRQQYFPQPGDKPEVIKQKRANRDLVMKQFIKSAGNAYSTYQETDMGGQQGGQSPEGTIISNGKQRLIKRNGQWQPLQ